MVPAMSAILPLQLLCQLIAPGAENFKNNAIVNIAAVNQSLPEGYVAYPDIGMAYKIHNEAVTWATARKLCFDQGSQLALIDTPKKMEHVVSQQVGWTVGVHVGIHKFDGTWISSSDGSPVSSSVPWHTDEPKANKNCVLIYAWARTLIASDCSDKFYYVCEIPIPASNLTQ